MLNILSYISAYLAGYIYTYSLAPFSIYPLAIISPLLLLAVFSYHRNNHLAISYCYGAGYFAAGGWVWYSLMYHTPCGHITSSIITVLFTLVLAISFLPIGFVQKRIAKKHPAVTLFAFPLIWLICEILRTFTSFAYPWLMIGYSQTNSPLIKLLPYLGPYLFSFTLILISSSIWGLFTIKEKTLKALPALLLLIISFCTLSAALPPPKANKELSIAVIQGNIAPENKWQPSELKNIFNMYTSAIKQHSSKNTLFLLPETAIPIIPASLMYDFNELQSALNRTDSAAILGTFDYDPKTKEIYNSAITIGEATGKLHKRKLVAFGETRPQIPGLDFIIKKLELPMATLSQGAISQKLLEFKGHKIAVFICYEIAFPAEVIARSKGAEIIIVLSDNAWFGGSSASYQHRQISQFYAEYLQKPVVFVNNNGLSAVIDSSGDILKSLALESPGSFSYQLKYHYLS